MSQVLALKYRPSSFDKLIGQDIISQTLSLALAQDRLSHAYLFSGLRGSGKTSTARIFAKALICHKGPTPNPCEVCENCIMANEGRHIDIIEMDAASSRKIDDIRDLIEHTKYKPAIARFKIFIIDEVHMLTREAFNALLKTLEEPPPYVKFILATTDPLKLPATILSRTQQFRFKKISKEDTVKHLAHILNLENIKYENGALEMIARAGNGSLRDTLTLLDQAIVYSKGDVNIVTTTFMLGLLDPNKLEQIFKAILDEDKKHILKYIKELESHECETVIDEMIAYLKDRFFEQDARFSTLLYERFFRILSEAKSLLFLNAENAFVLSLVFFKMMEALNIKKVDDMIEALESSKLELPKESLLTKENQVVDDLSKNSVKNEQIKQSVKVDNRFKILVEKLYDINYNLGQSFEFAIKFDRYEDNTLYLISSAKDENKDLLRKSSGIIRHATQDIFGLDVVLKMSQDLHKEIHEEISSHELDLEPEPSVQKESKLSSDTDILEHPFVKKAQELFDPEKIQIINKK